MDRVETATQSGVYRSFTPDTLINTCQLIADETENDAHDIDNITFTPRGVGMILGNIMAGVQALAFICQAQQQFIGQLERRIEQLEPFAADRQ